MSDTLSASERLARIRSTDQFIFNAAGDLVGVRNPNRLGGHDLRTDAYGFTSVKMFGAVGDFVNDDTSAIQAAIDYVGSLGGGLIIVPPGKYRVTSQLNITQAVRLMGLGWGDTSTSASAPDTYLTSFTWDGANTGTEAIVRVLAATASTYVYDWGIDGIALDGANKAYRGLWISSARLSFLGDLQVHRCRDQGWVIDDSNGVIGGVFTHCRRYEYLSGANSACASSGGLKITSVHSSHPGCTGIHVENLTLTTVNGYGLDVGDCDNSVFEKVYANATGTGHGVYLRGLTDSQTRPARKNRVGWFSGSDIYCEAASRNVADWVNSEGTRVTLESNAVLAYRVIDRNDGRRWRTRSYLTGDNRKVNIASGFAPAGSSAALATNGGIDVRMVSYANTGDNDFQWCEPPVSEWSGGKITSVRLWYVKSSSTHEGNVSFTVGVKVKGLNSGIGGVFTSVTQIVATDAAGTNTYNVATFTFGTAVNYSLDDQIIVNIKRNKASDALDTYVDAVGVTAFELNYVSNTANSDTPSYRYSDTAQKVT
jgi:hypothetical protein